MAEGRSDDFEMQDLGENYTDYDNMSFDELNQKDDLLNKRESIILSEFNTHSNNNYCNKSQLADIQNRRRYIDKLRMKILNQMDTSFIDSDGGRTVTIINKNNDTQGEAPGIKLFENAGNYSAVEQQNFDLAFKEQDEIESRLKKPSDFNREIAENQIKRTQIINIKIIKLYKKSLDEDKISKEIVDRSFANENGSIFFKDKGKNGILLEPKLIIKGKDRNFSRNKKK